MRKSILCALLMPAMAGAPAMAEPVVNASMPAIRASMNGGELVVRLDQGVLGSVNSLKPRTVVVVAKDAAGRVVAEETASVSRNMTYARIPASAAVTGASTVSVSVR